MPRVSAETFSRRCDRVGGEPVAVRSPAKSLCRTCPRVGTSYCNEIGREAKERTSRSASYDPENTRFSGYVNVFFSTNY